MSEAKKLEVTLVKSVAGRNKAHQACVRGLGLRRMHHTVCVNATPEVRGMIHTVHYLLDVKEV